MTTIRSSRPVAGRATVLLAAALAAAAVTTVTTPATASAPAASTFVPITPCRLLDTRPGDINVGGRATPLGAGETMSVATWGPSGNCSIPSGATALSMNVVSIEPTASSFLTVFPAGSTRPTASSLNWVAGQAPTPNSVTAAVSGTGGLSFYNLSGSVHLAVDVVGYFALPGAGATGPTGATGPMGATGPSGEAGVDPANEVWVAASGGDFTTVTAALASITDASASNPYVVRIAPGVYDEPAGVQMKSHVHLVGSGSVTVIRSTDGLATIQSTNETFSLRDLAVVNSAGRGIAIDNQLDHSAEVSLTNVDVDIDSSSFISAGIEVVYGSIDLDDVRATASGGASAVSALSVSYATLDARDLELAVSSSTATFCNTLYLGYSDARLDGVTAVSDDCNQVSRAIYAFFSTVTMADVMAHATAVSSQYSLGLDNYESTITADRLVAIADGSGALGIALDVHSGGAVQVVHDSELRGVQYSAQELSGDTRIVDSVFEGSTNSLSGKCIGAMNVDLTPFTCS